VDPVRVSIHGIFALGILYTLYLAHEVVLPITLATLTSLLLSPLVRKLARKGIPRVVSAFVLLFLLIVSMVSIGLLVAQPVKDWVTRAPEGIANLMSDEIGLKGTIEGLRRSAEQVEKTMEGLTEKEGGKRRQPMTVVLESESWLGQFLVKLRNGVVGLA